MIINVRDFGALGDGLNDDTTAVQTAISAAGTLGSTVYLPPGTYSLSTSIILTDRITLLGAGMGTTTLRITDGNNQEIQGLLRSVPGQPTRHIAVRDMTLDGNRDNQDQPQQTGLYFGVTPGETLADEDVLCERVEVLNFAGHGIVAQQAVTRLSLIECIAHHNGIDGFSLDGARHAMLRCCFSFNNDRDGFGVLNSTQFCLITQSHAYDNGGCGFAIRDGAQAVQLMSCEARANGSEGIDVADAHDNVVFNTMSTLNGQNGIRLHGSARATVIGNYIRENSRAGHDTYSEMRLEESDNSGAVDNLLANNHVASLREVRARFGIDEEAGVVGREQNRNAFLANRVQGAATQNLALNGRNAMQDGNI